MTRYEITEKDKELITLALAVLKIILTMVSTITQSVVLFCVKTEESTKV